MGRAKGAKRACWEKTCRAELQTRPTSGSLHPLRCLQNLTKIRRENTMGISVVKFCLRKQEAEDAGTEAMTGPEEKQQSV